MSRVVRKRFPNGLTLLCEEMHDAPVVALQAWVNVGSADETVEQMGLAHLHEHMLFKGTKNRGVGEIARVVEASGGEINAWTSFDETVYHVVMAAGELETGVDILADAIRHSTFDADELSREIEVVLEEIRRSDDTPARRIAQAVFSLAYEQHPYRRPVLGYDRTVRAFTRDSMLAFYKQHYRPERVTFVATGDFSTDQLQALVQKHFGDWQGADASKKAPRASESPQKSVRTKILVEDVKEARLALSWHGPAFSSPDLAAMDALAVILGHGDSSRLYEVLHRQHALVNDVYAYAYTPRDPGLLMVGAGLRHQHIATATQHLLDEVYRLRHALVPVSELEKAKVLILSESAYQRETVQGQARKLGFFETVGGDYAAEEAYLAQIKALVPDDLRRVAATYLHDKPSVVLQMSQHEKEQPAETALGDWVVQSWQRAQAASEARTRTHPSKRGGVQRLTLTGGAILLLREEDSPIVSIRAVGYGGQRWEQADTAGLAHLFCCIWGLATARHPAAALAEHVAMLGGSISAFAGRNTVGLRGDFLAEKSMAGLDTFCEALLSPVFLQADIDRERNIILERIRSRDDNPGAVAFDLFAEHVHPNHSYGLRFIGTEASLSGITSDTLAQYHRTFARPGRLVVSVAGGMRAAEVLEVLESVLEDADVPALAAPSYADAKPAQKEEIRHHLERKQSHVIVGATGVTLFDNNRYAAEVLTTILSGQSGRLFNDLRDAQSLAYSVSSSNLEGIDPGHVMVHMGTAPEKVPQALAGVREHLARLQQTPVTDAELARAKRYLVGSHAIELQRSGARAMYMALNERYGLGHDAHLHYAKHIEAVTAADVQAFARDYLAPERLVEVVVGPASV